MFIKTRNCNHKIFKLIDFHNHILPNTDDGSTSLEMSIEMLNHAANQGITDVVNTVHYKHPKVKWYII